MKPCTIVVRNKGRDAAVHTEDCTIEVVTNLEVTITDDEDNRTIVHHTILSREDDTLTFPVFYDETKQTSITRTSIKEQK